MQTEDPFSIKPLWDAMLEVHDEFATVCRKYNLRYYLGYGTAIGAVRHQGFVPWDDDFDVIMPRKDYEKFVEVCDAELPPYMKFVDYRRMKTYPWMIAKVMDARKEKVEGLAKELGFELNQGIFIDIVPYDGFPSSKFGQFVVNVRRLVLRLVEFDLSGRPLTSWIRVGEKIFGRIFHVLFYPTTWTTAKMMEKLAKLGAAYDYETSRYVGFIMDHDKMPLRPHLKEELGEPRIVPFHGRKLPVPAQVETFLKKEYGDYMTLPPESKRHLNHVKQEDAAWKYGPVNVEETL